MKNSNVLPLEVSLSARDRSVIWHPFTQTGLAHEPLVVTHAEMSKLFLDTGEALIDGISSWWCNLHGHGHPKLAQAAFEQFKTLDHVLFAGCTHQPAIELAERLISILPGTFSKVFYSDNGSTAVEVALKMAVQWWHNQGQRRSKIIALENSYHGDTFGAMAAGARGIFTKPFDPMLFSVEHISTQGSAADLQRLKKLCQTGDVAAFIFEPRVQGAGGMNIYADSTLNAYVDICKEFGVLTIADEVMTGFGRTGPLFASSVLSRSPDLICLSKGLTSGSVPLSVTACSSAIFDGFTSPDHSRTFFHGHTYTGNPIACAIALASLELTTSAACSQARAMIEEGHKECAKRLAKLASVENVRVAGTILAFDISSRSSDGYTSSARDEAMAFFRSKGVLLRPLGPIVYCMPPYCITKGELDTIHSAIIEFAS